MCPEPKQIPRVQCHLLFPNIACDRFKRKTLLHQCRCVHHIQQPLFGPSIDCAVELGWPQEPRKLGVLILVCFNMLVFNCKSQRGAVDQNVLEDVTVPTLRRDLPWRQLFYLIQGPFAIGVYPNPTAEIRKRVFIPRRIR